MGHRLGATLKATQFYGVYDFLDIVLPVIAFARVDRAAAEAMAVDARRQAAQALLTRDG